jgi:type III pantothenate kinase
VKAGANIKRVFQICQIKLQKSVVLLTLAFYRTMNLVVDIGNTKVKAAVFESNTLMSFESFKEDDFENMLSQFLQKYTINACILSSVKVHQPKIIQFLEQIPYFIQLHHTTPVPFTNLYSTPTTLGIDRIALVAGASETYAHQNVLIVDAGTCITYDFINKNQEYLGGAISPGIQIRYRAVHDYTSKLPQLEAVEAYRLVGDSTETAIHSGILNGVVQEIQGVINQYQAKYSDLTVILTGGDTKFLSKQLKNSIFAHQNFLLHGLNRILTFNNKE